MKKLLKILLSLLVVITIGCTKDSKEKCPVQSIVGEWKLIAYENFKIKHHITLPNQFYLRISVLVLSSQFHT